MDRREMRPGTFLREIEVMLSFDLATAKSIRDWLDQKLTEYEVIKAMQEKGMHNEQ